MKILIILVVVISGSFFFQNCSQHKFRNLEQGNSNSDAGNLGNGDGGDDFSDEIDIGIVKELCQNERTRKVITVSYPQTSDSCKWEQNGNLSKKDAFFRARREEVFKLELPEDALICGASFDFNPQPFRYDDFFSFNFNESVIASGYDFSSYLSKGVLGLLKYDWTKIRGINMIFPEDFPDSPLPGVYCAGIPGAVSNCNFPPHDTEGSISLQLDDEYIQAIMS